MEEPPVLTDFGDRADPLADYLSENYGILLGNDVVVDLDAADMINQPFVAISAQFSNHPITENMGNMATFFPTARSITLSEVLHEHQPDESDPDHRARLGRNRPGFLMDSTLQPDEGIDPFGPLTLAVAVEDSTSGAKLVVFGDAEFPLDANYEVYGNGTMMVNAIDWAAGEEDLINLSTGTTTERYLNLSNPYLSGLVLLGSIVVIPGLIVVAGLSPGCCARNEANMIRRSTWIVLVIFIVLVAAAILWPRLQKDERDAGSRHRLSSLLSP